MAAGGDNDVIGGVALTVDFDRACVDEAGVAENALDTAYRRMLRDALAPGSDPIAALKVKILADSVEEAATNIERFTRALSIAAIKET